MNAVVEEGKEVIGNNTLDRFAVVELQAHPQAVELGAAEEGLALGLEMVGKLAHEIDAAHVLQRHGLVRAVWCQHVEGLAFA